MTVTVEIMKQETLGLLEALENMGLIHMQHSVPHEAEAVHEDPPPYLKLRGIHKNLTGGNSVESFLADCHADKEREFEIERRQQEESARFAKAKSPS